MTDWLTDDMPSSTNYFEADERDTSVQPPVDDWSDGVDETFADVLRAIATLTFDWSLHTLIVCKYISILKIVVNECKRTSVIDFILKKL